MLMAALGTGGGERDEIGYLWPCNVDTWRHWEAVQTQWRVGVSGATGLDYAGVLAYLAVAVPGRKKRTRIFSGICAAEYGALAGFEDARKRRKQGGA